LRDTEYFDKGMDNPSLWDRDASTSKGRAERTKAVKYIFARSDGERNSNSG